MREGLRIDKKRLDVVIGKTANWKELAKDCVCFANTRGGTIFIGIDDKENLPPQNQKIDAELPNRIKKRISENTINVGLDVSIITAENGGDYIELKVLFSSSTIASTTSGVYYYRSDESCVPLLPDELSRLFNDKPSFVWETKKTQFHKDKIDSTIFNKFKSEIKASQRVSNHVKDLSDDELLDHYLFVIDDYLTNLGVLWLGKRIDRARLSYSPTIHFIKYDHRGEKINKILWEDYSNNPMELIEAVWTEIPDWKEGIDVSDGMFRKFIPNYEEEVIRELLANAIVHRPYNTRGDIFINLYVDRLEIVNPGLFPIGVTPQNLLHKNVRRNPYLAQIFYDLHLMDKEGSGIDKIYRILLGHAKPLPIPFQGDDFVMFTINRTISKPEIISFMNRVNEQFSLTSKELISLGLIAQYNSLSALEISRILALPDHANVVSTWIGKLIDYGLIDSKGKTKGTEYFINTDFLKKTNFKGKTNLKRIENHRLEELIFQDVKIYQPSPIGDIHTRIGKELNISKIRKTIQLMITKGVLIPKGEKRYRTYSISIEQK